MTFSLAARCPTTGMLGGVVTTSSPAVGSRCLHTQARVGVVLSQFWTDPRLGPRGLSLLAEGCRAAEVMRALEASTAQAQWRQLAVLDAYGGSAHFSGSRVKPEMNGASGENCVAIGNILASPDIPARMVAAFDESADLAFPERLLAALDAGEAAGGEGKPLVSAAIKISLDEAFPYVDLRIDASGAPLRDLRVLWEIYAPKAELYVGRAIRPDEQEPVIDPTL